MGHEELTLDQLIQGGGRFFELSRMAIHAAKAAGATVTDVRQLWRRRFQDQVALVLIGTHKIVPLDPVEVVRSERRPLSERLLAVSKIADQKIVLDVATDLGLSEHIRRRAFLYVYDETMVMHYAKTAEHGDVTDERLLVMRDEDLLYDVAMNSESLHAGFWAAKALVEVSPQKAQLVAVTHEKVCGPNIYRWGRQLVDEITNCALLAWIYIDTRAHTEIREAAHQRLSFLREQGRN